MDGAERKRILLIDDDNDELFLTKIRLERHNLLFDVEVATSAEEGLRKLNSGEFDCIVSDYDMRPGMNGLELMRTLQEKSADVPTIIVSSSTRLNLSDDALLGGAFEFVPKESGEGFIQRISRSIERATSTRRAPAETRSAALSQRLRALEREVQCYRAFFRRSQEMGVILGPDGKTVEEVNDAAARLFGPTESARGDNLLVRVHSEDRLALSQLILRVLSRGADTEAIRFIDRRGVEMKCRVGGVAVRIENQVQAVVLFAVPVE